MLGSYRTHGHEWSRSACVDGPGVHKQFGSADDVLDRPERLVDVSDRLSIVEGIGAQNPGARLSALRF